ncbi:MAG: hypothetical protein JO264_14715 [Acidisphaera sp.]|nr:hypothetical protein [Acidisphaera sp.]
MAFIVGVTGVHDHTVTVTGSAARAGVARLIPATTSAAASLCRVFFRIIVPIASLF